MAQDTLNKKLAEWAGIRYEPDQDEFKVIFPDGSWYNIGHDWKLDDIEPDFTNSLDACFKWLVPKLYGLDGFRLLSYQYVGLAREVRLYRHSWGIHFEDDSRNSYSAKDEPALALCLAISELIDGY